jgi:hypothetical protein
VLKRALGPKNQSVQGAQTVKQLALFLTAVIFGLPAATAAESPVFSAGDLFAFCNTNDEVTNAACRFFIFGAALGLHFGDGVVMQDGKFESRHPQTFCIPDNMGRDEMVSIAMNDLRRLARTHPDDLKSPALSIVAATFAVPFPCK